MERLRRGHGEVAGQTGCFDWRWHSGDFGRGQVILEALGLLQLQSLGEKLVYVETVDYFIHRVKGFGELIFVIEFAFTFLWKIYFPL